MNYRKEALLNRIFLENISCSPKSLNVPDRLCLETQVTKIGYAFTMKDITVISFSVFQILSFSFLKGFKRRRNGSIPDCCR